MHAGLWFMAGAAAGLSAMLGASRRPGERAAGEPEAMTLKGMLAEAAGEAWGQEESGHWMRDWCPGCMNIWGSLSGSGICAWCCAGGPAQPDRPAFYEELDIGFTEEGEDMDEVH